MIFENVMAKMQKYQVQTEREIQHKIYDSKDSRHLPIWQRSIQMFPICTCKNVLARISLRDISTAGADYARFKWYRDYNNDMQIVCKLVAPLQLTIFLMWPSVLNKLLLTGCGSNTTRISPLVVKVGFSHLPPNPSLSKY